MSKKLTKNPYSQSDFTVNPVSTFLKPTISEFTKTLYNLGKSKFFSIGMKLLSIGSVKLQSFTRGDSVHKVVSALVDDVGNQISPNPTVLAQKPNDLVAKIKVIASPIY